MEEVVTQSSVLKTTHDRLGKWVADFLFHYEVDTKDAAENSAFFISLVEHEDKNENLVIDDNVHDLDFEAAPLHEEVKQLALEWNMPITPEAMVAACIGADTIQDVMMVLAVVKWKFITVNRKFPDRIIDVGFVSQVFHMGAPSREYLDKMWEQQILPVSMALGKNLLEHVCDDDFEQD